MGEEKQAREAKERMIKRLRESGHSFHDAEKRATESLKRIDRKRREQR